MDSRFVNVTGDTMSGNLTVSATGDRIVAVTSTSAGGASFNVTSGTNTGQMSQSGTTLFVTNYASGGVLAFTQAGTGSIRFTVNSVIPFQVTPTGVSVSGNITSTGTAHNFAANSITASAILGLPTAATVAPLDLASVAAAGSSATYARADHQHKLPTYSQLGPLPVAAVGQAGAVRVGAGLTLAVDGTVSVDTASLPSSGITQAAGDLRYVNITGDTMTGDLIVNAKLGVGVTPAVGFHVKTSSIFLDGFVSSQGSRFTAPIGYGGVSGPGSALGVVISDTRSTTGACIAFHAQTNGTAINPAIPEPGDFAFLSEGPAPSRLGGDLDVQGSITGNNRFVALTNGKTLAMEDRGATLANVRTDTAGIVITIPTNAAVPLPVGTRVEILDLAASATTAVKADTGVTLTFNASITGGATNAITGGNGASVSLAGPYFKATLYKIAANTWVFFAS
jgi:hypothetical protein